MESFNLHKSYTPLPNPTTIPLSTQNPPRKPIITTIAAAAALLLTLLLLALLAIAIFESINDDDDNDDRVQNQYNIVRSVCAYTPHPAVCIATITPSLNSNNTAASPHLLLSLSLLASAASLTNLTALPKEIIKRVDDSRTVMALRDCEELFGDALGTVEKAAEVAREAKEGKGDLETWVSAAMTDLETCVDGLGEVRAEAVKGRVEEVNVRLSNSLGIAVNMEKILKEFGRG
ncbi:hypothetical protein Droror1_Dr00012188 [Drosera rotundifolia]